MNELALTTRITADGSVVLTLLGELDFHTAPRLRAALADLDLETGQRLVLDLGALSFCDSSGISMLIGARNHATAAGADIALAAVPARVLRIFTVVGLDQVFTCHPSTEDALAARAD
jgi:anti-anti-sigma factor